MLTGRIPEAVVGAFESSKGSRFKVMTGSLNVGPSH